MWRVVLDSEVMTSALLNPHASAARLLDYALQGRVRLFATPRMVANEGKVLRDVALSRRHGLSARDLARLVAELPVLLCMVPGQARVQRGTSLDAEVLTCATQSHADFIVTSRPLDARVALQGGTQIVTADQLVRLVGRSV